MIYWMLSRNTEWCKWVLIMIFYYEAASKYFFRDSWNGKQEKASEGCWVRGAKNLWGINEARRINDFPIMRNDSTFAGFIWLEL